MNDEVVILESIPKKIRWNGIVWIPETKQKRKQPKSKPVDNININFTKPIKRHEKQNYFVKWLKTNKLEGDVFDIEDFYMSHPKHKKDTSCRSRIDAILSEMIQDKKLLQIGKDRFKVLE